MQSKEFIIKKREAFNICNLLKNTFEIFLKKNFQRKILNMEENLRKRKERKVTAATFEFYYYLDILWENLAVLCNSWFNQMETYCFY